MEIHVKPSFSFEPGFLLYAKLDFAKNAVTDLLTGVKLL
jgi:hypothetical protein